MYINKKILISSIILLIGWGFTTYISYSIGLDRGVAYESSQQIFPGTNLTAGQIAAMNKITGMDVPTTYAEARAREIMRLGQQATSTH